MEKVRPIKNDDVVYHPEFVAPYVEQIHSITCVKCGKIFNYRGLEDDKALEFGCGICTECQKMMSGGTYDGMTVGDLYNDNE